MSKLYSVLRYLKKICVGRKNVEELEYVSVIWNLSFEVHSDRIYTLRPSGEMLILDLPPYSDRKTKTATSKFLYIFHQLN